MSGRLHAAGKSVPLWIEAAVERIEGDLRIEASAEVDQRLLGMTYSPLGMVGARTELLVEGLLVRD